jgi:hypothetical protein
MTLYETVVVVDGAEGVAVAGVVVVVRGTVIVEVLFNVDVPKIALAVLSSPQLFIILRQGIGPVRSVVIVVRAKFRPRVGTQKNPMAWLWKRGDRIVNENTKSARH